MHGGKEGQYLNKKVAIGKQLALVLAERKEFQEGAKKIRQEFNIPSKGVGLGEPIIEWQHKFWYTSDQWRNKHWPEYRQRIRELEESGKFLEADQLTNEFNHQIPINKLRRDIKQLLVKCRLGKNWFEGVERYVKTNNIDTLRPDLTVSVGQKFDEFDRLAELSIGINKTTTLDDIRFMWPMVQQIQDSMPDNAPQRMKPSKQIEHGIYALGLKDQGKPPKEIAKELNKNFDLKDSKKYAAIEIPDLIKNTRRKLSK